MTLTGYTLADAAEGKLAGLEQRLADYGEERAAQACGVGVPTLRDVVKELLKPGRDLREELPQPLLRTDVMELKDLKPGMELQGTRAQRGGLRGLCGHRVHQDGLVHISELNTPRRVRHPLEVLSVGDVVTVWVKEVEEGRKRIALTMRRPEDIQNPPKNLIPKS